MENKISITLNNEDMDILKKLLTASTNYSNNTPVSNSDVISGLLRFYQKARLVSYHNEYRTDIASYIGNQVQDR